MLWQRRPMHEDVAAAFRAEAERRGFVVTDHNGLIPEEFRAAAGGALQGFPRLAVVASPGSGLRGGETRGV